MWTWTQNVNKNVMPIVETCIDPPSAHFSFGIIEGVPLCMDSKIHINNAPYTSENAWPKWKHGTNHVAFTFAWMPHALFALKP